MGVEGKRIRVLVLYGGRSGEHGISCLSAEGVCGALDPERYEVTLVGIRRDGRWVRTETTPHHFEGALPEVTEGAPVTLPADPTVRGLLEADGTTTPVDVVFPVLHGEGGEDGTVQGLLELAELPYVGSGVLASAVGLDKAYTKVILAAAGIPVTDGEVVRRDEWEEDPRAVRKRLLHLGPDLFVKPARAGSSLGVTRIRGGDGIRAALEGAFAVDTKALVEKETVGREVECAVLSTPAGVEASLPGEILMRTQEWYDFTAKYTSGASELVTPAELPEEAVREIQELSKRAYRALECEGLARVDLFLTESGASVNEVNTMPGFTAYSMYPRMWATSGRSYPELVDLLIEGALRPVS